MPRPTAVSIASPSSSPRSRAARRPRRSRSRSSGRSEGARMISVPAIRLHQFGVVLYQAILGARDVDRLVRFEVLSYEGGDAAHGARPGSGKRKGKAKPSPVNWELLEKRIASSAEAYQRPVIRKKISDLVEYYLQCS